MLNKIVKRSAFNYVLKEFEKFLLVCRQESIDKIIALKRNCSFDKYTLGWQCEDQCVHLSYVCDGIREQCLNQASDEDEGCNLFPGNHTTRVLVVCLSV